MRIQITNGMVTSLVMTMIYAKALGVTQGIMAREVDGDIWISTILATIQGALLMLLTVWIIRKSPSNNFIGLAKQLMGPWIEKLVGFTLCLFFVGAFCTIQLTFTYHILDYFLPDIPIWFYVLSSTVVSLYGLFLGFEVIARAAFLGILCMLIFNILMILGSVNQMDIREMLPLFQAGYTKTLWASRHADTDWAMAILMVAIVLPQVKDHVQWLRSTVFGVFFGGIVVLLWPILETTVITPEVTAQHFISCMQMARTAQVGPFIQRYELIMVALFILPLFIQLMMCLYCASAALSQTLKLKNPRVSYVIISILASLLSYWIIEDHMRAFHFIERIWPVVALPIGFGLPILMGLLGMIRKNKLR